ncbi:MAG: hypothetical protein U5J96_09935 [Ignavibacteriaceae bacterium]|nr:hypothetical protein [Ignavibacteriaceae bacterium]
MGNNFDKVEMVFVKGIREKEHREEDWGKERKIKVEERMEGGVGRGEGEEREGLMEVGKRKKREQMELMAFLLTKKRYNK